MSGNLCRCGAYPGIRRGGASSAAARPAREHKHGSRRSHQSRNRGPHPRRDGGRAKARSRQPLAEADLHYIGQGVPRVDGVERVTGAARYTADVRLPGMLLRRYRALPIPPRPPAQHRRRAPPRRCRACAPCSRARTPPPIPWHGKASRIFDTELRHEGDEVPPWPPTTRRPPRAPSALIQRGV